jgi:hypothetical protein
MLYREPAMPLETKPSQRLSTLFLKQPCWKIGPLAAELHYSVPSVRRFLAKIGYLSSFTHNGAWYTLGSIPRFDTDGLWFYSDIGFSRAGSLTNTLVELTTLSAAGLSAEQLGAKLHCRCHSILVQLCRQGRLSRQKLGSAQLYFAHDPEIASLQRQAVVEGVQLPAEIAVLILAQFIRSPECSFEQLAQAVIPHDIAPQSSRKFAEWFNR